MSWLTRSAGPALCNPLQFLSSYLSYLLFFGLEAYCLIEILRHTGFLDFNRGTSAPSSRSLCSLSSSLQRTQPSVKLLSLELEESRILYAAPAAIRSRSPLNTFCTVQLRTLWQLSVSTTSGPGPWEFPGFWGPMVFCHAPIPRMGWVTKQQQVTKLDNLSHFNLSYFSSTLATLINFRRYLNIFMYPIFAFSH